MKRYWLRKSALFVLFFIAATLFFGFVVMGLWNAILPSVLQVSEINFWQALGLLVMARILFGGFRGGGWNFRRHQWRENMEQKMAAMTPEEREKFKQEWRNRCR